MAKRGLIVVRAGNAEHAMALSSRDVYLLDGQYFFKNGWQYRKLLGLNFFRGLKSPSLDVPLVTHKQFLFLNDLQTLLDQFETQRDLITLDYSCGFESEKHRSHGGAESGFSRLKGFRNDRSSAGRLLRSDGQRTWHRTGKAESSRSSTCESDGNLRPSKKAC